MFCKCDIWLSENSRLNYFAMLAFYFKFRRGFTYCVHMNIWKLFWMNDRLQEVRWPLKDLQRGLFAAGGQKRDQNSLGHGSALKEGERQQFWILAAALPPQSDLYICHTSWQIFCHTSWQILTLWKIFCHTSWQIITLYSEKYFVTHPDKFQHSEKFPLSWLRAQRRWVNNVVCWQLL